MAGPFSLCSLRFAVPGEFFSWVLFGAGIYGCVLFGTFGVFEGFS